MMGPKANAAAAGDLPEYAEVNPTGRYGRVRHHLLQPPFLDSILLLSFYQIADPFFLLCSTTTFLARARPRPCKIILLVLVLHLVRFARRLLA